MTKAQANIEVSVRVVKTNRSYVVLEMNGKEYELFRGNTLTVVFDHSLELR